jgi:hypothetical protein
MVMKVGLVSDTHGFLDSATLEALSATPTSAIIHAGIIIIIIIIIIIVGEHDQSSWLPILIFVCLLVYALH